MSVRRAPRLAVAALLAFVGAAVRGAAEERRVVAVGDVHGAFAAFHAILHEAGLVGTDGHWTGGEAMLVQTGDLVDRGADSLRVVEWLMGLQGEARAAGGDVVALLGNHEVMNLIGDMRYTTPEMMAPLVDDDSEKRRRAMCKERAAIVRAAAKQQGVEPPSTSHARDECIAEHPLGWVEYFTALAPDQPIGRWLRSRPSAVEIDDTVYVHGGISPALAATPLAEINATVHRELAEFEAMREWLVENELIVPAARLEEMARAVQLLMLRAEKEAEENGPPSAEDRMPPQVRDFFAISQWLLLRPDGPFWFRDYATWTEEEGRAAMPAILAAVGAEHVVVGHTPQEAKRIQDRFDDAVFLIDTGMLADVYEGVPSALERNGGHFTAIYLDHRDVLATPPVAEPTDRP